MLSLISMGGTTMPQEPSEIALGTRARIETQCFVFIYFSSTLNIMFRIYLFFFDIISPLCLCPRPALTTMTVGMLVFASLISNINTVINDGSLIKFEEKMEALDEFFKHRNLPVSLLERVRQYHEKIFDMSHGACEFSINTAYVRAHLRFFFCLLPFSTEKSPVCQALTSARCSKGCPTSCARRLRVACTSVRSNEYLYSRIAILDSWTLCAPK